VSALRPPRLHFNCTDNNQDVLWKERSRLRNKLKIGEGGDGGEEDASVLRESISSTAIISIAGKGMERQAKANIGDKGEILLPDMAYTCRHRGMKEFKIRSDGMPLSNQLAFLHSTSHPRYMVPTS
jgi:hypothetical protein